MSEHSIQGKYCNCMRVLLYLCFALYYVFHQYRFIPWICGVIYFQDYSDRTSRNGEKRKRIIDLKLFTTTAK